VKTTRAESFSGLIPASLPRTWMFPRWTVRMVVFVGGSTHRIDRAYQRAEALFRGTARFARQRPGPPAAAREE